MKSSTRTDDVKIDPAQALNEAAIGDLARESGQPINTVRKVYEDELARLKAVARIPDYLVLLSVKRTRQRLADSPEHSATEAGFSTGE
jgi:uncharacterized protein (DUF2126 family)